MNEVELNELLFSLISRWENEVVEFKEAGNDYDTDKIGKYFSALSNEANLRGEEKAWLVFGVSNKTRLPVGTDYRSESERLQSLKLQISQSTEPSITFRNIYEFFVSDVRVVLFEIPCAPRGMAIAWKGHYHARAGESIIALGLDKLDEIREQTLANDWSAQVVANASLDDLDIAAVQKAREYFERKYANRFSSEEMAAWPIGAFLDRAKVTQNGKITRTALLLLGKPESAHLLSPHPVQMTWKLEGTERAYEHFGPPFLLTSSLLYQRIRNIQLRLLPHDELLPIEVSKYDQKIVLEALHNCIAHQDYMRNGRIIVTEWLEKLTFENEGSFYEGKPDDYISGAKTPRRYRNPFLAQAMTELNMIDTMGYGIYAMHIGQARRYFPMPDYNLLEPNVVKMTMYGGVVDPAYSKLLMQKTDLLFDDILALDRVQKKLPLPDEAIARLRRAKLIEGRKPHFHVALAIAAATEKKAEYIRMRTLDDSHYIQLIKDYLTSFGVASRKDIDELLINKLSDALNDKQKKAKVGNLLSLLRARGVIQNRGSRIDPQWELVERKVNL
jgi:ATP-dependent DNA helicase RecG